MVNDSVEVEEMENHFIEHGPETNPQNTHCDVLKGRGFPWPQGNIELQKKTLKTT